MYILFSLVVWPMFPRTFFSYIVFKNMHVTLTYLCCNYSCVRPLPTTLLTVSKTLVHHQTDYSRKYRVSPQRLIFSVKFLQSQVSGFFFQKLNNSSSNMCITFSQFIIIKVLHNMCCYKLILNPESLMCILGQHV